jgi:lysophospholipase L1-like esterase
MNLQTNVPLKPKQSNQIDYKSKVLLIGSCFSENIGNKFNYFKFQHLQNPLGILFHPLAIERLIANAIGEKEYKKDDIFNYNEQWHCFEAHSKLSNTSEVELLQNLNTETSKTHAFLKEASHIIITLGTAWAYRFIESDSYVANCHKVKQKKFLKELLSVDEIKESLDRVLTLVGSINPKAQFIFTVSPVRHIKDGFVQNTQSKAHLITAIHHLLSLRTASRNLAYFPAFEIMIDELRDYRYYSEDMLHPNKTGINYIWHKFKLVWITEETKKTMDGIELIQKGMAHKPFNENSEAHQNFISKLKEKQKVLSEKHPHIIF